MLRKNKYQEQRQKISRFQALKSIFSSFVLTTTAIVIAVIVIPKSPVAKIDDVKAFTNAIAYSVTITDSDNAIIEGSLQLVLENQFDEYNQSANLGVNTGIFDSLDPNTEYTLKIMADKGFGLEVLDKLKIETMEVSGGAITDINLLTPDTEYLLDYQINYYISDPFSEYQSLQIRYGYRYSDEYDFDNFQTIALMNGDTSITIPQLFNNNIEVLLRLEAITYDLNTITLDEISYFTPYQFYGEAYIDQVTNNSVSLSIWSETEEDINPSFELVLMESYYEVARKTYTPPITSSSFGQPFQMEADLILFERLKADTDYSIRVLVTYINPYNKNQETKELSVLEFTTSKDYSYDLSIEDLGDSYRITIVLDDPEDFYDLAYYRIYRLDDSYDYVVEYNTYQWNYVNDTKSVTFVVNKQVFEFRINIGISNSQSYNYYIVLDKIEE